MKRIRILAVAISVAILLAGVAAADRPSPAGEPPDNAADRASAAASTGGGHDEIATGGYHFSIDPNFNGGIFGSTLPILNRVTFNAKRDADGSISGWFT
jgi:hypothetical protein